MAKELTDRSVGEARPRAKDYYLREASRARGVGRRRYVSDLVVPRSPTTDTRLMMASACVSRLGMLAPAA